MSKPTCPLPLAFDTFSRLFKKELGISVSDYIREKKSHQKLRLPRLLCRFSTLTGTIYIPCLQIRVVLHREYISRMVNTDLMPVSSCCDSLPKSCSLQFVMCMLESFYNKCVFFMIGGIQECIPFLKILIKVKCIKSILIIMGNGKCPIFWKPSSIVITLP